jgi:imidazolonepropionase-like amidohydrolase
MKHTSLILALLATTITLPAQAQEQSSTTYIHAGRLLDRPGQPARGASTIVVRDGKIAEILSGLVPAPTGVKLIDLSTRFVLPGLIDSHVHLDSDAGGTAALVESLTQSSGQCEEDFACGLHHGSQSG